MVLKALQIIFTIYNFCLELTITRYLCPQYEKEVLHSVRKYPDIRENRLHAALHTDNEVKEFIMCRIHFIFKDRCHYLILV